MTHFLISALLAGGQVALAALPQTKAPSQQMNTHADAQTKSIEKTKAALELPIDDRMGEIEEQGPEGYRNLVKIMQNDVLPMETRWRAVTAAARVGGDESIPELEYAMSHQDWFMRNAGLIAAATVDRTFALNWAKRLLQDKAMMVRVAAVDVLADMKDKSCTPLLWKHLNSADNYKGKQSLFIRRRIVEALADLESPGTEGKFIAVLNDADATLYPTAIEALVRLTGQHLGEDQQEPIAVRRSLWLKWWKEQPKVRL